ncbi:MAG: hypothetical protein LBT00_07205 [Spirochaetaceae bacterium]|nr:hypothetical protein [Spirochaetaceae bacterium]
MWCGCPRWLSLPKQYPPPSVIVSERHIAERSNPMGRPHRLDCFTNGNCVAAGSQ